MHQPSYQPSAHSKLSSRDSHKVTNFLHININISSLTKPPEHSNEARMTSTVDSESSRACLLMALSHSETPLRPLDTRGRNPRADSDLLLRRHEGTWRRAATWSMKM
jgi:hypothetical protein